MASSQAEPMPQTVEAYKKLAGRDLILIEGQQKEISDLKAKANDLQQRLIKAKNQLSECRVFASSLDRKLSQAIDILNIQDRAKLLATWIEDLK